MSATPRRRSAREGGAQYDSTLDAAISAMFPLEEAAVLAAIHTNGGNARMRDMRALTGRSVYSLTTALGALVRAGHVTAQSTRQTDDSQIGRPPIHYALTEPLASILQSHCRQVIAEARDGLTQATATLKPIGERRS